MKLYSVYGMCFTKMLFNRRISRIEENKNKPELFFVQLCGNPFKGKRLIQV